MIVGISRFRATTKSLLSSDTLNMISGTDMDWKVASGSLGMVASHDVLVSTTNDK